jgi:hypothetical protein
MNTIYKLILINAFILFSQYTYAQNSNAWGTIIDEHKNPAEFVTVALYKATDSSLVKTALTNDKGQFTFNLNKAGDYFFKASNMGYKVFKSKTLKFDGAQKIDFGIAQLIAISQTLKEVSVISTKPLIERKMDRLVMNVSNSTTATGSSALELLQKAPGVSVDQNDNISMLGKQGVMIQIDGKQTYMSNADVSNLLKNMQSNEIESIELISNPSSKYDASGNSGIINIKTKKGKGGGTNGSINAGFGYGKNYRALGGINLNHRAKNFNVFGNYNYSRSIREQTLNIDRIVTGNKDTYFSQLGVTEKTNNSNNFKFGFDYFINKNNTIGFLLNGYANTGKEDFNNHTLIGPSFSQKDSSIVSQNLIKNTYTNLSYNLNYKSVLDTAGQEISADLDYGRYNGEDIANYDNNYLNANGTAIRPLVLTRNITPAIIDIKAIKIDYSLPLKNKAKLEAGLKSSWVKTDNNLNAEEFVNSNWVTDNKRSNQFIYEENVNAAYVNFNKQFKTTSVQLGLRAEQTNSNGNSVTLGKEIKRDYLNFFPSVFINQTLNKNNDLNLSYSRRIDRPSYDDLNPFLYYLDQYTYNQGNPFLNPQYTHNFEATYLLKKKYSLTLNYSKTSDVITQVLLPNNETKAFYQTNENIATQNTLAAVVDVPVSITKWWTSNNNFNVFYINFKADNIGGQSLNNKSTSYQIKSMHNFKIANGLNAELNFNYQAPLIYGVFKMTENYALDAGISKSFINKKANLKLAVTDIFNTQSNRLSSALPGLQYWLFQQRDTRTVRLNFSYRFGNNEIKPARRRNTGLEAEQGRMKN